MLVFDTNIWVSYALSPGGVVGQCVDKAIDHNDYAFSEATFAELADVLMRPKFDPYFSQHARQAALRGHCSQRAVGNRYYPASHGMS